MNKKITLFILPLILFSSCRSISTNRTELGIPHSVVYFSFDDGPNARGDTTARLLDVLQKYQIRALFCLLGENAEQYPELVKRIFNEGHFIVNHGYSAKHAYRMNEDEFRNNLIRGEAAIANALGHDRLPYRLYRPQGGFYNSRQEKICIDEGYTIVPVTVRIYDAVFSGTNRPTVVRKAIRKLENKNGGIILLHDGRDSYSRREPPRGFYDRSWIPETVEKIIIALLDKGFTIDSPDVLTKIGH